VTEKLSYPDLGVDLPVNKENELNSVTEKLRADESTPKEKEFMTQELESKNLKSQARKIPD